jgi:transcriptional regulator with XRE-family HTH domain
MAHDQALEGFAQRLRELCEDKELPERGRQSRLGQRFKVSQQAARKWLDGLNYPDMRTIVAIAEWGEVNVNWLLQGVGPKHGNRVDAKVLVLDEALHALPREIALDVIDSLRAKLVRFGKITAEEPVARYNVMLDAYEKEISRKPH